MNLARAIGAELFEGAWKDGVPWRGSGRYVAKDGRSDFDGFFRKGAPFQGSGTWCDAKGNTFKGTVADAWPVSGEGAIVGLGNVYAGSWDSGTGQGTVVSDDPAAAKAKEEWRGEWKAPNAGLDPVQIPVRGGGVYVSHEGLRCTGQWSGGEVVRGKGVWRSASTGLLFDGEFLGSGAGKGKIVTLSSHDRELVFEGEWRSSLPFEGKGEIAVDGTTFRGDWKDGKRTYHGKKYEMGQDLGAAMERHLEKQAKEKASSLGKLRSISLRALPSMGAVPMKNSLNNAEDRRAAQRAARRERRKANARASPAAEGEAAAEGDAAAAEGDAAAAAADPAPASLLPALIDKGAAGRKSPAAAAQALVLNENSKSKFDLYSLQTKSELQKADDEQEQKKKRLQAMIARQKISLKEKEKEKRAKRDQKALTPLERAMLEAAERDTDGASGAGGGEKGSKKKKRPNSRGSVVVAAAAPGAASGKAGRSAVEGWLKNTQDANAKALPKA